MCILMNKSIKKIVLLHMSCLPSYLTGTMNLWLAATSPMCPCVHCCYSNESLFFVSPGLQRIACYTVWSSVKGNTLGTFFLQLHLFFFLLGSMQLLVFVLITHNCWYCHLSAFSDRSITALIQHDLEFVVPSKEVWYISCLPYCLVNKELQHLLFDAISVENCTQECLRLCHVVTIVHSVK